MLRFVRFTTLCMISTIFNSVAMENESPHQQEGNIPKRSSQIDLKKYSGLFIPKQRRTKRKADQPLVREDKPKVARIDESRQARPQFELTPRQSFTVSHDPVTALSFTDSFTKSSEALAKPISFDNCEEGEEIEIEYLEPISFTTQSCTTTTQNSTDTISGVEPINFNFLNDNDPRRNRGPNLQGGMNSNGYEFPENQQGKNPISPGFSQSMVNYESLGTGSFHSPSVETPERVRQILIIDDISEEKEPIEDKQPRQDVFATQTNTSPSGFPQAQINPYQARSPQWTNQHQINFLKGQQQILILEYQLLKQKIDLYNPFVNGQFPYTVLNPNPGNILVLQSEIYNWLQQINQVQQNYQIVTTHLNQLEAMVNNPAMVATPIQPFVAPQETGKIKEKQHYIKWSEIYAALGITSDSFMPYSDTVIRADKCKGFKYGFSHLKKEQYVEILKEIINLESKSLNALGAVISTKEISVSRNFFDHYMFQVDKYYQSLGDQKIGFEELLELRKIAVRILALRLVKEMRDQGTEFPARDNSDMANEFEKLCAYRGGYQTRNKEEKLYYGNSKTFNIIGLKCSGNFMDDYRITVRKTAGTKTTKSPKEIFESFKLVSEISSDMMSQMKSGFIKYPYPPHQSSDKTALSHTNLRLKLTRDAAASQFRPTFVMDVLSFCQANEIQVSKVADFCCGWGDRLVGYLGAAATYGITQYLGTDPNVELHPRYLKICQQFTPQTYQPCGQGVVNDDYVEAVYQSPHSQEAKFTVRIYKKPAEDLTANQLILNNNQADLMMTSIPYFDKEKYSETDPNQSYIKYPKYEDWKTNFLFTFVDQSVKAVRTGGAIAINCAVINKGQLEKPMDIPSDLNSYLQTYNKNGVTLSMVGNLMYDGKPDSSTFIYQVIRPEIPSPITSFTNYTYGGEIPSHTITTTNTTTPTARI